MFPYFNMALSASTHSLATSEFDASKSRDRSLAITLKQFRSFFLLPVCLNTKVVCPGLTAMTLFKSMESQITSSFPTFCHITLWPSLLTFTILVLSLFIRLNLPIGSLWYLTNFAPLYKIALYLSSNSALLRQVDIAALIASTQSSRSFALSHLKCQFSFLVLSSKAYPLTDFPFLSSSLKTTPLLSPMSMTPWGCMNFPLEKNSRLPLRMK